MVIHVVRYVQVRRHYHNLYYQLILFCLRVHIVTIKTVYYSHSVAKLAALVNKKISPESSLFVTSLQAIDKIKTDEESRGEIASDHEDELNEYLLDDNSPDRKDLPEVEVYVATLVLTTLVRDRLDEAAALYSTCLIERIRGFNRRSLDYLNAKVFSYFSLAYERVERLEHIRTSLLGFYRTACLHRDKMCQAVLLNLLLRNYLHYNLIDQVSVMSL